MRYLAGECNKLSKKFLTSEDELGAFRSRSAENSDLNK